MSEQITTSEEHESLPAQSLIQHNGVAYLRTDRGWTFGGPHHYSSESLVKSGPSTVLFRPDAPTPTPAERRAEAQAEWGRRARGESTSAGDDQREALEPCREARAPMGWESVVCDEPRGHAGRHAPRRSVPTVTAADVAEAIEVHGPVGRSWGREHGQVVPSRWVLNFLASLGIEVHP